MKLCVTIILVLSSIVTVVAQQKNQSAQALSVLENSMQILLCNDCWNQADDRFCEDDISNKKYSLFCALKQSQLELTGTYKHRGLVMKTIRKVIRTKVDKCYPHIIRDYNNLSSTSLEDILGVIEEASVLIEKKEKEG